MIVTGSTRSLVFVSACAALALSLPLFAQETRPAGETPETPKEPKAAAPTGTGVDAYKAMQTALANVKTASYVSRIKATGSIADEAQAQPSRVIVERGKAGASPNVFPGKFHIVALPAAGAAPAPGATPAGESRPASQPSVVLTECAFDGKLFRTVKPDRKTVFERSVGGNDEEGFFFDPAMQILMPEYSMASEMAAMAPSTVSLAGTIDIGGVACDVLAIERKLVFEGIDPAELPPGLPSTIKSKLYVGKDDHLPRGSVQNMLILGTDDDENGGAEPPSVTMTISELKVNVEVDAKTFSVAVPAGFEVKPLEMPTGGMGGDEGDEEGDGEEAVSAKVRVGDTAPAWSLKDADGKEWKLSDLKGKVVVLDFWATWCGPCKQAMPGMQKLHEKFKDRGVVVMGVNVHDDGDAAGYMKKQGYTYTCLLKGDSVAEAFGVGPIPQFFVIGVDGKVIHHAVGFNPSAESALADVIEKHLKAQTK